MEASAKFRCDACGQIVNIEVVCRMTYHTPGYCPMCGEASLKPTRTSFNALEAPCFAGIDPRLTQLLYEVWRGGPVGDGPLAYPTNFIDYWRQQLSAAITDKKGS